MEILTSTASLVAALAALAGGLAALLKAITEFRKGKPMEKRQARRFRVLAVGLLSLGGALGAAWSLGRYVEATERDKAAQAHLEAHALNVQLTSEAWDAYNRGDLEAAIAKARECIDEFAGGADRQQKELEEAGAPEPPTNRFTEAEKNETLARGLLNDVATSFYIVGRSAERLGRLEEAKGAYRNAARYTYARTWDPKGWFWSPAQTAADRLARLEN